MNDNEPIQTALKEFVDAMNILSMRVGLTVKDVADILNPIAESARIALKEKQNGQSRTSGSCSQISG